jgi:uncharacterized membrane protein YphA (DoxX/SURF4 family)
VLIARGMGISKRILLAAGSRVKSRSATVFGYQLLTVDAGRGSGVAHGGQGLRRARIKVVFEFGAGVDLDDGISPEHMLADPDSPKVLQPVYDPKPYLDDHQASVRPALHERDEGSVSTDMFARLFGRRIGLRVYGCGAIVLGMVGLAWGDFALVWQPVPSNVPDRTALAYAVAGVLLAAGLAVQWERTARAGAIALTTLYALCVGLLHIPRVVARPSDLSTWAGVAEQLALVAGGLTAYAIAARIDGRDSARLTRFAQLIFGVCLFSFGLVHFYYIDATASYVPAWLPPGRVFWACATGIAHWAAAVAIVTGVLASTGARLLTVMYIVFGVLVHAPSIFIDPASHLNWAANAMNLALVGAAWVIADSIEAPSPGNG